MFCETDLEENLSKEITPLISPRVTIIYLSFAKKGESYSHWMMCEYLLGVGKGHLLLTSPEFPEEIFSSVSPIHKHACIHTCAQTHMCIPILAFLSESFCFICQFHLSLSLLEEKFPNLIRHTQGESEINWIISHGKAGILT